jgi:hypothetical protein
MLSFFKIVLYQFKGYICTVVNNEVNYSYNHKMTTDNIFATIGQTQQTSFNIQDQFFTVENCYVT